MNWKQWWVAKVLIIEMLKRCPSLPFWINGKKDGLKTLAEFKIQDLIDIHMALCGTIVAEFITSLLDGYIFNVDKDLLELRVQDVANDIIDKLQHDLSPNEPTDIAKMFQVEAILNTDIARKWIQLFDDVQKGLKDLPLDITNVVEDNRIVFSEDRGLLSKWIGREIKGAYLVDDYTLILITEVYQVIICADKMLRFAVRVENFHPN